MKTIYLHSNKTEIGQYHDIAFLIDLICSNEVYENSVEACDIVTIPEKILKFCCSFDQRRIHFLHCREPNVRDPLTGLTLFQ